MTYYYWDEVNDNLFGEEDENGEVTASYTHEPGLYGELIAQERDGETRYYNYDGLGNTSELTDENENVTDTYEYSAFGEEVAKTGTTENPFVYKGALGYYTHGATGDYYVRRRPYDPRAGRWVVLDPVGFIDGLNRYLFVLNNPVFLEDPSGLWCAPCCCCADDLKLTFERKIQNGGLIGNEFKLQANLSYRIDQLEGDCNLEWWEWSPRFPKDMKDAGAKNRTWFQGYGKVVSVVFGEWETYKKADKPCPGKYGPITFTDRPLSSGDRVICIEVIVKSTPNCKCTDPKDKTIRLRHEVAFDPITGNPKIADLKEVKEFDGKSCPKR